MNEIDRSAEIISLFCRLNLNTRKNLPIRSSEMGALIFIVRSGQEPTPIMLSEFFKVSKPMVTSMINSLVKKGYLTKEPSDKDGRSYVLKPTEKAVELVEITYHEYHGTMQLLQDKMGIDDFRMLISLLDKANIILLEDKKNE